MPRNKTINMNNQVNPTDTSVKAVCYHDGECPLCRIEINTMKKMDKYNSIRWVDISKEKEVLRKAGITYKQAMDRIHVEDENGNVKTGVCAFLTVWNHLPYYRRMVPIIKRVPFLLPAMKLVYGLFARYRLPLTGKKQITEEKG